MHILPGLLASTVTKPWLLHRLAEMGVDSGGGPSPRQQELSDLVLKMLRPATKSGGARD